MLSNTSSLARKKGLIIYLRAKDYLRCQIADIARVDDDIPISYPHQFKIKFQLNIVGIRPLSLSLSINTYFKKIIESVL